MNIQTAFSILEQDSEGNDVKDTLLDAIEEMNDLALNSKIFITGLKTEYDDEYYKNKFGKFGKIKDWLRKEDWALIRFDNPKSVYVL